MNKKLLILSITILIPLCAGQKKVKAEKRARRAQAASLENNRKPFPLVQGLLMGSIAYTTAWVGRTVLTLSLETTADRRTAQQALPYAEIATGAAVGAATIIMLNNKRK